MTILKEIPIEEATATQLSTFASILLGREIKPIEGKAKILALLEPVYSKTTIRVPEDAPVAEGPAIAPGAPDAPKPTSSEAYWNEKIALRIHATDEKGGQRPVPVAVNGVLILVPRNQDVMIARKYVWALHRATKRTPEQDERGEIVAWRESYEYPIQFSDPLTGPAKAMEAAE